MSEDPVPEDDGLRQSLATLGLGECKHLIMAVTPDGVGIIRSNCDVGGLRELAAMLVEIANEAPGEPQLN